MAARTALITWIFFSPARGQDDVDGARLLLGAGAVAARRAGGRSRGGDRGRRDAELLLERLDPLGELEHGDALQLLDPVLSCHFRRHLAPPALDRRHWKSLISAGSLGGSRRALVGLLGCASSSACSAAALCSSAGLLGSSAARPALPRPGASSAGSSAAGAPPRRAPPRLRGRLLGRRLAGHEALLGDLAERDREARDHRVEAGDEAGQRARGRARRAGRAGRRGRAAWRSPGSSRRRAPRRPSARPCTRAPRARG